MFFWNLYCQGIQVTRLLQDLPQKREWWCQPNLRVCVCVQLCLEEPIRKMQEARRHSSSRANEAKNCGGSTQGRLSVYLSRVAHGSLV